MLAEVRICVWAGGEAAPGFSEADSLLLPFAFFSVGFVEGWDGVKGARFLRGEADP